MRNWISGKVFGLVHKNNLVYNTCWEDPRLDREAMGLTPEDSVLVITSAGCNALDYALEGPARIDAVDMNPRQNALLRLKIAAIRELEFNEFFPMFGQGRLPGVRHIYQNRLREQLDPWSRKYWDRRIGFFDHPRKGFYFRGTSGQFAHLINLYIDKVIRARATVQQLLDSQTLREQQEIYRSELKPRFWSKSLRFVLGRDTTLSMLGVPRAQREQVEIGYHGGIVQFIEDCLDSVFGTLPLQDNYFWRVYITGQYERHCCPEYLKEDNFQRLKDGLVDRIHVHTDSVQGFLDRSNVRISRFVLLDHMDWMASHRFRWLESEWQSILNRATPGTRILWRSGGLTTDFIDRVRVIRNGQLVSLPRLLHYHRELAAQLHQRDRVHTYGSFSIADLAA